MLTSTLRVRIRTSRSLYYSERTQSNKKKTLHNLCASKFSNVIDEHVYSRIFLYTPLPSLCPSLSHPLSPCPSAPLSISCTFDRERNMKNICWNHFLFVDNGHHNKCRVYIYKALCTLKLNRHNT